MSTRRKPSVAIDGEFDELAASTAHEVKERRCLTCSTVFTSAWSGERVCLRCKAKSSWRGGGCAFA